MTTRLRRVEQVEQNREAVLAAARRVFVERGYVGATLDAIAVEAGFSKGVVYSQFASKADLFLVLLERRIEERAAQNDRATARVRGGAGGIEAVLRLGERMTAADPAWALAVVEFRAQAARDPALNRRYADLHERTIERLAEQLAAAFEREGANPPAPTRHLAELVLALSSGVALERAADARALPLRSLLGVLVPGMTGGGG